MADSEDKTYLAGSEDYAIDLTENPLLQGGYETVLRNIFNNVKDTVFTPYTSNWQGNPALQAGDVITQIDRDGKTYNTLVTKSIFKYRGKSTLEAKGLPDISKGYKGSANRKIAQIKRKIEVEVGDRLTTMEEQILASTELIANMLGGYAIQGEDAFYIADNKDLSRAVKVWKWGLGGFGYSENGVNGPYTTAITADGSIVAMLVAANIITADMIQAGMLQSQDGSTWLNLDSGEFNLAKGNIWIDKDKVRVYHSADKSQYTDLKFDGIYRKFRYGESKYLMGSYKFRAGSSGYMLTSPPPPVRVYLPDEFIGRNSDDIEVMLSEYFGGYAFTIPDFQNIWAITGQRTSMTIENISLGSTPYVDLNMYHWVITWDGVEGNDTVEYYFGITCNVLVIG